MKTYKLTKDTRSVSQDNKTILVILEQHFVRYETEYYTDVQCDESFWNRYLKVFDNVIVCARVSRTESKEKVVNLLHSSRARVSFIGMPDFRGVSGLVKKYSEASAAIKRALKQVDAVLFRAPSPISMIAYPIVKNSGLPWATEMMMNPYTAYGPDSLKHPLRPIFQKAITAQTKSICMHANGVAYVTEHVLQDMFPCRAKEQSSRQYFTASYSTINLQPGDYSYPQWGCASPSPVVLAHSGKMSDDRKGHRIFLQIIAGLREKGINAQGILIGDGPLRGDLELFAKKLGIAEACDFVGWMSGFSKVQRQLQRAQFFVFPTKSEGLPRSIIEAMASGLICLANCTDGIPELLEDRCLSIDNTPESYIRLIEYYLSNWNEALGARHRQYLKSTEYQAEILETKRTMFYTSLRNLCE